MEQYVRSDMVVKALDNIATYYHCTHDNIYGYPRCIEVVDLFNSW
jgi:hypothetical protein